MILEPSAKNAPGVGLLLVDARGWILLQLRDDHGAYPDHWGTIGGAMEPGETREQALVREVFEETGYRLDTVHTPVALGSEGVVPLPDGRSRRAYVFYADYDGVQEIRCHEGHAITFVDPATLDGLLVYPGQRALIDAALEHRRRRLT